MLKKQRNHSQENIGMQKNNRGQLNVSIFEESQIEGFSTINEEMSKRKEPKDFNKLEQELLALLNSFGLDY